MNEELQKALEEHVGWINEVTRLAAGQNFHAVQKAIDDLDDDALRGVIYVLILARAGDWLNLVELKNNWSTAPLN